MSVYFKIFNTVTKETKIVPVKSSVIFAGRLSSNDLVLNDSSVSSRHCRLKVTDNTVYIEDLKSANGTFVAGQKVERTGKAQKGEAIEIGPFEISLTDEKTSVDAQAESEKDEYKFDPFAFVRPFLSPINEFLESSEVSEIMINGPKQIYIEQKGKLIKTDKVFSSEKALCAAVKNIGRALGKDLSEQNPRLDARLDDGSRVAAVIPPCALSGTYVSIRKFSKKALTVDDLISFGAITESAVNFLKVAVLMKKNIIVSGGTGSGKTTLLNVVSSLIPDGDRVIVIEDTAELQLQKDHVLRMEARPADKKGKGAVSIRDLLHSTLRMRPDRIVVGEIRGGEAFDLLQAMNTGHGGSMSTIHSNAPSDTLSRLENTTLQSGINLPLKAIREQISSAINLIVHIKRFEDGSRKLTHITEVTGLKEDMSYTVKHVFKFERTGKSKEGKVLGGLLPTGYIPEFFDEAMKAGYVDEETKKGIFLRG
jgi:pilus assembly protein CpaF